MSLPRQESHPMSARTTSRQIKQKTLSAPTVSAIELLARNIEQIASLAGEVETFANAHVLSIPSSPESQRAIASLIVRVRGVASEMLSLAASLETVSGNQAPQDKTRVTFDSLLASGELLKSTEFLARLGWTRQALSKAVLTHRMFYVEVDGIRAYPAFYLDQQYKRKDVESVTRSLGGLSGGSKWIFFTQPRASLSDPLPDSPTAHARAFADAGLSYPIARGSLGPSGVSRTPLQAIGAGDLARVKRAAQAYAER